MVSQLFKYFEDKINLAETEENICNIEQEIDEDSELTDEEKTKLRNIIDKCKNKLTLLENLRKEDLKNKNKNKNKNTI